MAAKPAAAPSRPKKGSKPKAAKQGQRHRRKADPVASSPLPRPGTKIAQILELLRRPGGAVMAEFTQLTGWQRHSVRGSLSGVIGKKHGLKVVSSKARTAPVVTPSRSEPRPAYPPGRPEFPTAAPCSPAGFQVAGDPMAC
jgi:Protein of unknown function (DUF3489)